MASLDSFKCRRELTTAGKTYVYYDLKVAEANGLSGATRLPNSLKVLLENLLRFEDGRTVTKADIQAVVAWLDNKGASEHEIAYRPARVLMQDFTGVPAVVDLAAMRDATTAMGGDPQQINPLVPVDLVIDHSVMVDHFAHADSFAKNVALEYERNGERYRFLKWGATAFNNFRVVPPGTGICHQVNLEHLGQTVWTKEEDGVTLAYPDTCVGTDSHTTMINGIAVLGWGVGGIEAEAAMLGQPVSMLIPEVVGVELTGKLPSGATATDLVLTVTQMLRKHGVVGKFVEFFGEGLDSLSLEDRATISNMAPEYGATCGFFPIDEATLTYLRATGREPERVALVEAYAKANGFWRTADPMVFTDTLHLELADIVPSLAGPKRPQDRVTLADAANAFALALGSEFKVESPSDVTRRAKVEGEDYTLGHGDVVIAAITSCTNTSNPSVLIAAGLLARNARKRGLNKKPFVKTSLAPGSQVVTDYLAKAGLQEDLDALGFNLVGYGCTTCIGNSGPLPPAISKAINENGVVACSVLSGNRNFEGRVSPDTRANYLASPPLVVAYAIAGSMNVDLLNEPIGYDDDSNPVFMSEIWPSAQEIAEVVAASITPAMFAERYADVFKGDARWQAINAPIGQTYAWEDASTYVQNPPFFADVAGPGGDLADVTGARVLGLFGDSITTDHISPAGSIKAASPAGEYLMKHGVTAVDFNSYGARRGNHEVMMRGTFANIRIKNLMLDGKQGGLTVYAPTGEEMPIYDAAMRYQADGTPLVIFAGKDYGMGSSRDWAAKGTRLLGVKAVVAESFERIHRSNLIGMGVLPLEFLDGASWSSLGLTGDETVSVTGVPGLAPRANLTLVVAKPGAAERHVPVRVRIDTDNELDYFKNGGILQYVLRNLAAA